jgi:NADP-dependent alcohol dehydrogenase
LPANLQVRRQEKREKLLQYAARVWQIVEGDEEQRIDTAIARTRAFFEQLGLPTRLSDYGLGETDIEIIITQLKSHNLTQLGERKNVSSEISRQILEMSI